LVPCGSLFGLSLTCRCLSFFYGRQIARVLKYIYQAKSW